MDKNIISGFKKEYEFLSPFHIHEFMYKENVYSSLVNVLYEKYVLASDLSGGQKNMLINKIRTGFPMNSKRLLEKHGIAEVDISEDDLYEIILEKFSSDDLLKEKLLETGSQELIYLNTWGDTRFGMCLTEEETVKGENLLGKALMRVRTNLLTDNGISSEGTNVSVEKETVTEETAVEENEVTVSEEYPDNPETEPDAGPESDEESDEPEDIAGENHDKKKKKKRK